MVTASNNGDSLHVSDLNRSVSGLAGSLYIASDWEDKLQCLLTDKFRQMTDNQERLQAKMKAGQQGHYVTIVIHVIMM
jgi:hypothetical protein